MAQTFPHGLVLGDTAGSLVDRLPKVASPSAAQLGVAPLPMANVLEKSRLWLGERTPHLPPFIPESPCLHVLGISLPGTATLGPSASQTTWLWKPWEWGLEVRTTSCRKCVSQSEAWSVA